MKSRPKSPEKSQGKLKWDVDYGKAQTDNVSTKRMFSVNDTKKEPTKVARWDDRNAIDLRRVRAKLKRIQRES